MLSALIPSKHSYPAMLLAEQLAHQRFVLLGPLVLEETLLKYPRLRQIGGQPVSRIFPYIAVGLDYTTIPISREINVLMFA